MFRVVKEGGIDTLIQVSTITLCGTLISNLVCYLIWPQKAVSNLRESMIQTLESFSTLLPLITGLFLLENDTESHIIGLEKVQQAVENHQSSFTSLKKNLREAKREWMLTGSKVYESEGGEGRSGRRAYEDAVDCLNRLAQHLNGLRSGTRLQQDFTRAGLSRTSTFSQSGAEQQAINDHVLLDAAAAMFGSLVDELGPPMRALSVSLPSSPMVLLLIMYSVSLYDYYQSAKKCVFTVLQWVQGVDRATTRIFPPCGQYRSCVSAV